MTFFLRSLYLEEFQNNKDDDIILAAVGLMGSDSGLNGLMLLPLETDSLKKIHSAKNINLTLIGDNSKVKSG